MPKRTPRPVAPLLLEDAFRRALAPAYQPPDPFRYARAFEQRSPSLGRALRDPLVPARRAPAPHAAPARSKPPRPAR